MRTSNPVLNDKVFDQNRSYGDGAVMTIEGTVNKTGLLLLIVVLSGGWVWAQTMEALKNEGQIESLLPRIGLYVGIGAIGGLIMSLITVFKKSWSPVTAPLYAFLQGLFLGGISAFMEKVYPGIVVQAVALTLGTLGCLLLAYKSKLIQVTDNFRLGVVAATGGIFLVYLVTWILGFFNINVPFVHSSGLMGIGFSLFVIVIAALNLVLDFDFIENAAQSGAAKYMEWYASFGLIVTLIWLYIEILKLLAKLRSRD